jgi:hypothetical protein
VPHAPPAFQPREDLLAALRAARRGPGNGPAGPVPWRAIAGLSRDLGSDHPSTADARNRLAILRQAERYGDFPGGRYEDYRGLL